MALTGLFFVLLFCIIPIYIITYAWMKRKGTSLKNIWWQAIFVAVLADVLLIIIAFALLMFIFRDVAFG